MAPGEIREFVVKVLQRKGWPAPPAEFDMHDLYAEFDRNGDYALDQEECMNFAHAVVAVLLRALD